MDAVKTGNFISELRKEKNMTQKQLADILSVSDKAISRWETGKGFPEISIMENLADALDVSIAEIIKAERLEGDVPGKELIDLTDESFTMYKNIFKHQRFRFFLSGLLFGLIILIIAMTHLNSPIYYEHKDNVITVESLNDKLIASVDDSVAGCEYHYVENEGDRCVFVNCYKTKWYELFGRKQEKFISLGNKDDIDFVYYYPGEEADVLIYSNGRAPQSGVISLPRLIYNYWIIIGIALSFVTMSIYLIFRKRYYAKMIFRVASFFISFTLSIFIVLAGKMNKVYNASYYLSGILLISILFTVVISLYDIYRSDNKRLKNS